MTTYAEAETSLENNSPDELYEFTQGLETWRYTSSQEAVSYNTFTWEPAIIRRTRDEKSKESKRTTVEVKIATNTEPANRYNHIPVSKPLFLKIYRFYDIVDSGNQARVPFYGRLIGVGSDKRITTMRFAPLNEALLRQIPRRTYQAVCNHVLYDAGCKMVPGDNKHEGLVTGVLGDSITINGLGAALGGGQAFKGGYVEIGDAVDFRLITDQAGDTVALLVPFRDNVLNTTVKVFRGCDHLKATCAAKFNNVINFGGFPYVPSANPFNSQIAPEGAIG